MTLKLLQQLSLGEEPKEEYRHVFASHLLSCFSVVLLAFLGWLRLLRIQSTARAATICVSAPNGSIGAALAAAQPGDTLRVAAGTYVENLVIDKVVTLEGGWNADCTQRDVAANVTIVQPADDTMSVVTIDGPTADPSVPPPVIDGFTITGGRAAQGSNHGGGVRIIESNAVIRNNHIYSNTAYLLGGGVGWLGDGQLRMINNVIRTNTISATAALGFDHIAWGGGVYASGGGLLSMDGDLIERNRALDPDDASSLGGGIYQQDGQTVLNNLTVLDNEAVAGGGILVTNDLEMNDSTVAENQAEFGGGVYLYYPNTNSRGVVRSTVLHGNHATRGGGLFQFAGSVDVENSAIISNVVDELEGGGLYTAYGLATDVLTVTRSTVTGNRAPIGAGVYSNMALHLATTTVRDNVASDFGGGLVTRRAATVVNSSIVANAAVGYGAALSHTSDDAMTLQNVTISGNDAGSAGAVYFDGDADLVNVTITDNSPTGVYWQSGDVTLVNALLAANDGPNCSEALTSLGYNLEDADTCGLDPDMDDLVFADPLLGPLTDNGGPTLTHAIDPASPAVDAADNNFCLQTDQRGKPRVDGDFDGATECDIGAYERLSSFTVNSTRDAVDDNPGNGICETVPGNDECTLRAAIQEVNQLGGAETITLPTGVYTLTIPGADEELAATGDLDIYVLVSLIGSGALETIIDANGLDRVFHLSPVIRNATGERRSLHGAAEVKISGVTVQNGSSNFGGGIYNNDRLLLTNSIIRDSRADMNGGGIFNNQMMTMTRTVLTGNFGDDGGGLFSEGNTRTRIFSSTLRFNTTNGSGGAINNNGTLWIEASALRDNQAASNGGALFNNILVTLLNTTLSGNRADRGGAMRNGDTATLINVTLHGNQAIDRSGAIENDNPVRVINTLLGDNAPENCAGVNPLDSLDFNLEVDDTCGLDAEHDLVNVDPLLGPLQDNGGPATGTGQPPLSHALQGGSPAIDSGDTVTCPTADQRGASRPVDGDGDGVADCDIGAYEYESVAAPTATLTATSTEPPATTPTVPAATPSVTPIATPTVTPTLTPLPDVDNTIYLPLAIE